MNKKYLNLKIIGGDETGVGDYFTPLVVAVCFVPSHKIEILKKYGVQDSKKLSDNKINYIFDKIKIHVKSSVRIMSQSQYNLLTWKFKYNANELKTYLYIKALNAIETRINDHDLIVIDQFASPENMNKYIQKLLKKENDFNKIEKKIDYVINGESEHIAIAAASIIARAYLNQYMKKQNQTWNCIFPLGASKKVIAFGKQFVDKHGEKILNKIAKKNFKTTKKILNN